MSKNKVEEKLPTKNESVRVSSDIPQDAKALAELVRTKTEALRKSGATPVELELLRAEFLQRPEWKQLEVAAPSRIVDAAMASACACSPPGGLSRTPFRRRIR